jgi:hypothetical protein
MLMENHPVSVFLLEDERIPRDPNVGFSVRIGMEVVVPRFNRDVRKYLHSIIVIEGDRVTSFHEWNKVDANCFSPVERLLVASSRKQPG